MAGAEGAPVWRRPPADRVAPGGACAGGPSDPDPKSAAGSSSELPFGVDGEATVTDFAFPRLREDLPRGCFAASGAVPGCRGEPVVPGGVRPPADDDGDAASLFFPALIALDRLARRERVCAPVSSIAGNEEPFAGDPPPAKANLAPPPPA